MRVIGIVGMPGSGKGEFSNIAQKMGIPVIVMGDVIREEVKKAGLPPKDSNMGVVAKQLREKHGMAAIAKVCIPVVKERTERLVLIDGIRGDAEVAEFHQAFPSFRLISIDSPLDTRLSRLKDRGRSDDLNHIDELKVRDERESSFGLKTAIEMAEIRIPNTGTLDEFRNQVSLLLNKILEDVS